MASEVEISLSGFSAYGPFGKCDWSKNPVAFFRLHLQFTLQHVVQFGLGFAPNRTENPDIFFGYTPGYIAPLESI